MKTSLIKTLAIISAALLPVLGLSAAQYSAETLCTQPFVKAATASNQTAAVINATDFYNIGIQMTLVSSNPAACYNGATTHYAYAYFSESMDGLTFSNPKHVLGGTVDTNSVYPTMTYTTNITLSALGYLRCDYITNAMSVSDITNVVIKYSGKPRRRD